MLAFSTPGDCSWDLVGALLSVLLVELSRELLLELGAVVSRCCCSGPGAPWALLAGRCGHGTQVNVTCIVNVCSGPDHSSQCPSQAGSTRDTDASTPNSPKEEQVPFSKEERPFQSQPGAPETLLQGLEEKPLPLGVPDAGMKPS